MKLNIRTYQGADFQIDIDPSETVDKLKDKITASQGHNKNDLRLLYLTRLIDDNKTMEELKFDDGTWLLLMVYKPIPPFPEFEPPDLPEFAKSLEYRSIPWNPTEAELKEMFMQKAREKAAEDKAEREKAEREKAEKAQQEAAQQGDKPQEEVVTQQESKAEQAPEHEQKGDEP